MRNVTPSARTAARWCALVSIIPLLHAQVTLNPNPTRVLGHNWLVPKSAAPNLVEGREFNAPQGVAVDTRANPPILYVSDFSNSRVLAWRSASSAREGAFADLVIGQRDMFSTSTWGPGTSFTSGLTAPTGLAVDAQGNLYVVDTGNNRILRFPKPFEQPSGEVQVPDLVIGQTSLNSNRPNAGGVSASTIAVNTGGRVYRAALGFDGQGNLYFTDAGNHRILRYPATALAAGAPNGPAADVVIGQPDFLTTTALKADAQGLVNKNGLNTPAGLAVSQTHVLVSDFLNRVLIYPLPVYTGEAASRIMGVPPATPTPPAVNDTQFSGPEGIALVGSAPAVCDLGNNRILIFDPVDQWPVEATQFSPKARTVVGQRDMFTKTASAGSSGLSAPVHAVFFNNELYVADAGNNRVVVFPQQAPSPPTFTTASRVVGQLGMDYNTANLIEGKELSLGGLGGVAVDVRSDPPRLYVADTANNRVLGYRDIRRVAPGYRADLVIGQQDLYRSVANCSDATRSDAGLCLPIGLAVDSSGDLYVADSGNARVLRFPRPFSQSGLQRANLVLGQSSFTARLTDPTSRNLAFPYALALTLEGHLAVSDMSHNRVLLFKRPPGGDFTNGMAATAKIGQPDFTSTLVSSGSPLPLNRFNGVRGIALDSSDRLHACDTVNNRVLIFGSIPALSANDDPSAVVALTGLRRPQGAFVSLATGEIWVADTDNDRALRYPHFDLLPARDYKFETTIPDPGAPLALALDGPGNLLIADGYNRVAFYYPALVPTNAASGIRASTKPLSPGVIASAWPLGGQFGSQTAALSALPMPRDLGEVQLLFNDQPVPLFFVSPGQINFLVPMGAPTSGLADLVVVQASTGQPLASGVMQMAVASPALFTTNQTGSGLVAALNQDNSVNSTANPAGRDEVIQLFLTGQGYVPGAPPDGEPASGLISTPEKPRVWIESNYVPDDYVQFSGLAPGYPGLWQINVKIPNTTAPGNRRIYVLYRSISSMDAGVPNTQIAVK